MSCLGYNFNLNDSINVEVKLLVNLNTDNEQNILNIYTDLNKRKIYSDTLQLMNGNYIFKDSIMLSLVSAKSNACFQKNIASRFLCIAK